MTLADVKGQSRVTGLLRRALDRGQLAHAYVFAGPPGVGKRTTALALARATSCTVSPGHGCDRCGECRLIAAGVHPDVFLEDLSTAQQARASAGKAGGEPSPRTTRISIEQVHRLQHKLALAPVRTSRKVGIVDQAELLSLEAQDALLKTLEEPPGTATLILLTVNPDALLPTILSRCQRLVFAPLSEELVAGILAGEGVEAARAREAAADAGGSLALARSLASEEGRAARQRLVAVLEGLPRLGVPETLDLARALADPEKFGRRADAQIRPEIVELASALGEAKDEPALLFAVLLGWFRARLVAAAEGSTPDAPAARRDLGQLDRAYATSRALARNANSHLAWDRLLLELRTSW